MAQEILKPLLLDETGKEIVAALNAIVTQLTEINETLKAKNTDSGTNGCYHQGNQSCESPG